MKADELKLEQFYKISTSFNQKDPQERMVSIPAAAMGMLRMSFLKRLDRNGQKDSFSGMDGTQEYMMPKR